MHGLDKWNWTETKNIFNFLALFSTNTVAKKTQNPKPLNFKIFALLVFLTVFNIYF